LSKKGLKSSAPVARKSYFKIEKLVIIFLRIAGNLLKNGKRNSKMNHLITKAENTGLKSCNKKGFTVSIYHAEGATK